MPPNNETTRICVNNEFGSKLNILFRNRFGFYFVPILDQVSLFLHGIVHNRTRFGKLVGAPNSISRSVGHAADPLVNYDSNSRLFLNPLNKSAFMADRHSNKTFRNKSHQLNFNLLFFLLRLKIHFDAFYFLQDHPESILAFLEVVGLNNHSLTRDIWHLNLVVHGYGVDATRPDNLICFTFGSDTLLKIFILYENTKWENLTHFRVEFIRHSVSAASFHAKGINILVWVEADWVTFLAIRLLLVLVHLAAIIDSWLFIILVIIVVVEWWRIRILTTHHLISLIIGRNLWRPVIPTTS